jgi:hypothetical protein
MVVSEGVLESTPSRLGLLDAVIEVLKLAGGNVAPCGGAGCRPRTHDLTDLVEREAHLAEQEDRPDKCDRGFVVSALPRPSIVGLQDVELLVVAQADRATPVRCANSPIVSSSPSIILPSKVLKGVAWPKAQDIRRGEVGSTDESGSRHLGLLLPRWRPHGAPVSPRAIGPLTFRMTTPSCEPCQAPASGNRESVSRR